MHQNANRCVFKGERSSFRVEIIDKFVDGRNEMRNRTWEWTLRNAFLGRSMAVTSSFELAKAIEAGSTLKLNVVKRGLINIPVPCIDVSSLMP